MNCKTQQQSHPSEGPSGRLDVAVIMGVSMAVCIGTALTAAAMSFVKVMLMKVKQPQQHQHEN